MHCSEYVHKISAYKSVNLLKKNESSNVHYREGVPVMGCSVVMCVQKESLKCTLNVLYGEGVSIKSGLTEKNAL